MSLQLDCNHSMLSYGIPVFYDETDVMEYFHGVRKMLSLIRDKNDLKNMAAARQWLSEQTGFSIRTIEGWEQGRMPEAKALLALQHVLATL